MNKFKKILLKNWLNKNIEIEIAILFGSYAKGIETEKSDVDLALLLLNNKEINSKKKLEFTICLSELLEKPVDLIDLTKSGQPLLSQIVKYGELLKGSKRKYIDLMIKNINTTQDFMPYIERIMKERRKRYLNG